MPKDNDKVGYKKPPKSGQFRKGQSGNPKGRPKGAKSLKTELLEELNAMITVTENGKTKRITRRRAVLLRLIGKAFESDVRAISQLAKLALEAEREVEKAAPAKDITESDRKIMERLEKRIALKHKEKDG